MPNRVDKPIAPVFGPLCHAVSRTAASYSDLRCIPEVASQLAGGPDPGLWPQSAERSPAEGVDVDVVRTRQAGWDNGRAVVARMKPAWIKNLGPDDKLDEAYAKYNQKTLVVDPQTSFCGDLVRIDAGYPTSPMLTTTWSRSATT